MELKNIERVIIFIAPTSSQPRYHKRVQQLASQGDVHVFAFKRGYYNNNTFPSNKNFYSLGLIQDGKYIKRIYSFIKAVKIIRETIIRNKNVYYYAMSFDCLLIAQLSGIKKGFYEIGDLRITEKRKGFLSIIEAMALKKVTGVVLTSKYFYEKFYVSKSVIPKNAVYFIDNKLNAVFSNQRPLPTTKKSRRIKIGLIGLLRYKKPIELLLEYVKERPKTHVVECYGDGPLTDLVKHYTCENIRYHGSFKNPKDLEDIYNSIDVSYVVYDYDSLNVRLAIPNKLYESAFFGVPILCGKETALSIEVSKWKIGKAISIDSPASFEAILNTITNEWILECKQNCFQIPEIELIENEDAIINSMFSVDNPNNKSN